LALAAAIVGVVLATLATVVPRFLLARAESRGSACFDALIEHGRGRPDDCLPAPWEIGLAARLPWFEGDAARLRAESSTRAATIAYGMATAVDPNVVARSMAGARLLELRARGLWRDDRAPIAWLEGDFAAIAAAASASDAKGDRARGFDAARTLGDIATMKLLARGGDLSDDPPLNLRRGAALCLANDAANGVAALRHADEAHRQRSSDSEIYDLARVALAVCGGAIDGGSFDARNVRPRFVPGVTAAAAEADGIEALGAVRILLEEGAASLEPRQRLRLIPYVIDEDTPLLEALALLAPRGGPVAALANEPALTPWVLLAEPLAADGLSMSVARARRAAAQLEALAAPLDDGAMECGGNECPADVALRMPKRTLREVARAIWLDAAIVAANVGLRDDALHAATRAAELSDAASSDAAAIRLAARDHGGAIELLTSADEREPASAAARMLVQRALAHAGLGKMDAAYRDAALAYRAAERAERETPAAPQLELRVVAAWLWVAFGLDTEHIAEVRAMLAEAQPEQLGTVADWLELCTSDEGERRSLRWNATLDEPVGAALPAAMYVVGRALPPGAHVEVWLDRIFHAEHQRHPLRAMLARAEAARWRADEETAERWQRAADELRVLMKDDRGLVLAELALLR
jgi:hypothetical protein